MWEGVVSIWLRGGPRVLGEMPEATRSQVNPWLRGSPKGLGTEGGVLGAEAWEATLQPPTPSDTRHTSRWWRGHRSPWEWEQKKP